MLFALDRGQEETAAKWRPWGRRVRREASWLRYQCSHDDRRYHQCIAASHIKIRAKNFAQEPPVARVFPAPIETVSSRAKEP